MEIIVQEKVDIVMSPFSLFQTGKDLFSQAVSHQVPSALRSLTSVFEMGTGVASPLYSPDACSLIFRTAVLLLR